MNYEPYYSEGWKNNEEGGTPITAASLNHVDDGLLDHDEDLQNIFGDMATIEEDETASQSYAVGDYLILDGLFYKVTTAISTGGSIAPGTNCEQTTVSDELNKLNSKFIYKTDTNSESDGSTKVLKLKASFTRVLSSVSQHEPGINRSYPILVVVYGSATGTYTGTIAITTTAIRFLLFSEVAGYAGVFLRSTETIQTMYEYTGESV